jgi:hypothetical protein
LGKAVSLLAEKDRPGRVQTLERWLGLERPPRGLILMALSDALPYVGRKEQVHIMEIFQRFLDCPSVSIRACAVHSIGRGIVHLARADRRSYLQNLERAREDVDARVRDIAEKNIEDLKARGILKR